MNRLILSAALAFIMGCSTDVDVKDSVHDVVQSGSSYTYVVIQLGFISELNQLCLDSLLPEDYESERLYKKEVAQCTLDKLSIFNFDIGQIQDFSSSYCEEGADLSEFTPEQRQDILAACSFISGGA